MSSLFIGLQRSQTNTKTKTTKIKSNKTNTGFTEKELSWFNDKSEEEQDEENKKGIFCNKCNSKWDECEQEDLKICSKCGDIIERNIDSTAEYRFFGYDDRSSVDPCRVGAPIDLRFPSSTLGTIILSRSVGGPSTAIKAMLRIRRYHTWNMIPYKERSLLQVFEQYALTATNFGINMRAIDTAKELYVQLVEHCDRRGMSKNCVIASSIYAALKMVGEPRKPKEIADMFNLTTAQFTKAFKYFQEVLALARQRGHISESLAPASAPSTRASDYITHPLSQLPICRAKYFDIQYTAIKVANKAEDDIISPENMPPSLAAGVLAFVLEKMGSEVTLGQIATVCNVSEGTLTKCLKRLEDSKDKLWPI